MAARLANRFALIADDNEGSETETGQLVPDNVFANQVTDNDAPWEQVGRGGATKKQLNTLVIRDGNVRSLPSIVKRQQQNRDNPTSSPTRNNPDTFNPYENYCGACSLHFNNKSALLSHIKQNTKIHANFCNLCKRVFKDRNGLQNHVDNSQGHDTFCNLCLSAFKNQWGLKNHFENNYSVGHEFICLACLLGFKTKTDLNRHLQTGEKHVSCNTCHRKFRNQDERDAHWVATAKHKHCLQPGCDFDANTSAELEKHLEDDHFQCEGCKHICPSQTKLSLHYQACKFDVPCPSCGEMCAGQIKLGMHMESCFCCAECGWSTDTDDKLQDHLTKHTAAGSNLLCWACTSQHRTPHELTKHLESCPAMPPTLLLSILGKWWYSTLYMDLDMHASIRRHEVNFDLEVVAKLAEQGELHPFICRAEGCEGKTFSTLSGLVAHVEAMECDWDVERLRLDGLKMEFGRASSRRDSGAGIM